MKIILFTGAPYAIPSMHYLAAQNMLHSVISPGEPNKNNIPIELNAQHLNIPFKRFLKNELLTGFKEWITAAGADMVLVFGCGYKIPSALFTIPKFGFFNVHFSLLPVYRGRSPVFWQIKNSEQLSGITIHQMTENFDAGDILMQQQAPVSPGDTLGLLSARLSLLSVEVITKAIEKLGATGCEMLFPQDENSVTYFGGAGADDLKIDWQIQSATEIEALVNATNPEYGGAITLFRNQPLTILEVTRVNVNNPSEFAPGSIVHADVNYGIIVACKDMQFLRVNIVQSPEGILSGFKLAGLGIAAGERFESAAGLSGININP